MNDHAAEPVEPEAGDPAPVDGRSESAESGDQPAYARFDCTDLSDSDAITAAAASARRAVESGECIVLPTDTVYGIGADAYDAAAVQRLLDAKGRGRDMPPPVLIADPGGLKVLTAELPEAVQPLVEAFWPGALTIICEAAENLRMDLGETRGTVAVRVPDHPLTRRLLRQTGPMAVSSANRTGRPAALTCDDAIEQLGDRVGVYLDGGPVGGAGGKPSTMIDFTVKPTGQVVRRGAIELDALRGYLPEIEDLTEDEVAEPEPAPGFTVEELRARHTLQPPLRQAQGAEGSAQGAERTDAAEPTAAATQPQDAGQADVNA